MFYSEYNLGNLESNSSLWSYVQLMIFILISIGVAVNISGLLEVTFLLYTFSLVFGESYKCQTVARSYLVYCQRHCFSGPFLFELDKFLTIMVWNNPWKLYIFKDSHLEMWNSNGDITNQTRFIFLYLQISNPLKFNYVTHHKSSWVCVIHQDTDLN